MEKISKLLTNIKEAPKDSIGGFLDFIRSQGVVGLAIGFILGGAVSKFVASFVENIINPLLGLLLGSVNLTDKVLVFGQISIKYGAFLTSFIDFLIISAVVYFGFKALGIDKLDKKKE